MQAFINAVLQGWVKAKNHERFLAEEKFNVTDEK